MGLGNRSQGGEKALRERGIGKWGVGEDDSGLWLGRQRCELDRVAVLASCVTKDHKLVGLKHQKFIFSQFWRLEV